MKGLLLIILFSPALAFGLPCNPVITSTPLAGTLGLELLNRSQCDWHLPINSNMTKIQNAFTTLPGTCTDQFVRTVTTSGPTCSSVAGTDFSTQSSRLFLAGPTSGSPAKPTFRGIGDNDLPGGTTSVTWTIDSDNTAAFNPVHGAGLIIEGGSGDVELTWNNAYEMLELLYAAGVTGIRMDRVVLVPTTFAALGSPEAGAIRYCANCTKGSDPCTSGGSGAYAKGHAARWDCN